MPRRANSHLNKPQEGEYSLEHAQQGEEVSLEHVDQLGFHGTEVGVSARRVRSVVEPGDTHTLVARAVKYSVSIYRHHQ